MKIDGGCHCGAIAYEAELDLDRVAICHCSDCQSLSGSVYRTVAIVAGDTFEITKGRPKEYVKVGDSGNRRIQAFCGQCGSALYATDVSGSPAAYNLRVGTIRQRAELVPKMEFFCRSAMPWLPEVSNTVKFDGPPK
ncbi:MAG: GFA family protein [Pseudomonadota bacterium]